jgi:hypothetical protein
MSSSWKKYRNSLVLLLLTILYPLAISFICPTGMKSFLEQEEVDASALFYSENDFSRRNYYQNRSAEGPVRSDSVISTQNFKLP